MGRGGFRKKGGIAVYCVLRFSQWAVSTVELFLRELIQEEVTQTRRGYE